MPGADKGYASTEASPPVPVESLSVKFSNVIAATSSFTFCSMGMMVFNKMAIKAFPLVLSLVAVQMGFTVLVMVTVFAGSLHFGSIRDVVRWSAVAPFFVGMLLTSMLALKDAPMSLVITFRAASPLITVLVERLYPNPAYVGPRSMAALLVSVLGALMYASGLDQDKKSPEWRAIGWVILNTGLACTERLLQRLMLSKDQAPVDISKTGCSLLNNLFGVFPLMLAAYLMNETGQIGGLVSNWTKLDMMWVFLSCCTGVGISYCAIWTQTLISATSMLALTNANKFAIIALEVFVLRSKRSLSYAQIAGALLAVMASIAYAQNRALEEKERNDLLKKETTALVKGAVSEKA